MTWVSPVQSQGSLNKREAKVPKSEKDRTKDGSDSFEDRARDSEPRNMGGLQNLKRGRKQLLFENLRKEYGPTNTLILAQWKPCWTSNPYAERKNKCVRL